MSEQKTTRFSFSKNNMAAAAEMQKNEFGQTILGSKGDAEQPSSATEIHADPVHGIVARPRSIMDSPQLQEFLNKHLNGQAATATVEPEPTPPPELDLGDEDEFDEFGRSVLAEPDTAAPSAREVLAEKEDKPSNLRRFSAPIQSTLHMAKFCHECGLNFGTSEKFCPHCGTKRAAYAAPRSA